MAIVFGTEPANFSLALRPQVSESCTSSPIISRTSGPTIKDTISTRLRVQTKSSTTTMPTSMDDDFEEIMSKVTSLDMVTKDLLDSLQIFRKERIEFKYLKVSLDEYENGLDWLDDVYCETTHTIMEYNYKTGTVIVNKPGDSVMHIRCQMALESWLAEIADSPHGKGYESQVEMFLWEFQKSPDACLRQITVDLPIIMVEVGFSERLDEMFDRARELFRISNGVTQVVILLKIYEEGRSRPQGYPWGLTETEIQARNADHTLVDPVLNWHKQNQINVVGNLKLHMYFWDAHRKHPPPKPIWEFETGPSTLGSSEGAFERNMRNSLLDREFRLNILGGSFPLPIERLRKELEKSVGAEMRARVGAYLRHHDFPSKNK